MKKRGLIAPALVAAVLLLGSGADAAAAPAQAGPITQNTDLLIYDPSGARLLGRAHYAVTAHDGTVTIEGRNAYIDGEYDVEHDTLKTADGGPARMVTYEHSFFDAQGAPQIVARANALSGESSCAKYENGKGTIQTAVLEFPPDTYAGAGVLVPIADQLRRGDNPDLDVHVFDCAAGPRILTLHADLARALWRFRPHDGELAKAEAHPVFGWFNIFLKPFEPTIRLWFDPLRDFAFVGGMLSRYYRGPEVLMVSAAPAVKPEPRFVRPELPALTAPHDSAPPTQSSSAASALQSAPSASATATPSGALTSAPERIAPAEAPPAR